MPTAMKLQAEDWNLLYRKLKRAYDRTGDIAIRQAGMILGFDWARCLQ